MIIGLHLNKYFGYWVNCMVNFVHVLHLQQCQESDKLVDHSYC